MTGKRLGNNKFLKEFNQTGILDLIRLRTSVSKAEISKLTGLSPTAVGIIVSNLIEKGYIHEVGTGKSKGGRRPVLLELMPGRFYSIGVDIDVDYISFVLVDITGRVIYESTIRTPNPTLPENIFNSIEDAVEEIVKRFNIGFNRLLGFGIAVPGMVDSEMMKVVFAPNLGWENIDIQQYIKKLAGVRILVENEAMASAICENWIGCCQGINNFVCVNVKTGIGAGIFADGRLYKGSGGCAGEVGHIMVDENGPKCGCGNYGCLETMASTSRVAEKAKRFVRQGAVSSLNELGDIDCITIDNVIEAARHGDITARNVLAESARYMGIALSSIVNTLNPSKIVLGKEFTKYADLVIDYINEIVGCKALKIPASKVEIVSSGLGEKTSVLGASIIPLKALFGR